MGLLSLFKTTKTETEKEMDEFRARRQYERQVFEAALEDWLLKCGLGGVMMKQRETYAERCGIEPWPDQFNHYNRVDFDPRRSDHREIAERIGQAYDEHDYPQTVHIVTKPDADPEERLFRAFPTRKGAEDWAGGHDDLRIDEVEIDRGQRVEL